MTFLYAAGLFAVLLSFLLFFVDRWSLDLVQAGAAIVPMGLVVVLLTTRVGCLADLVGYRFPLASGASLMAFGLVLSAVTLSGDHFAVRWVALAVLLGLGVGLCYPLLAAAAVHELASADLAAASALNQSARQLGAALGAAAAVGVLGSDPLPSLERFHAVWLLAAAFCALAAIVAGFLPGGSSDLVRNPVPSPTPHPHEGVLHMMPPDLIYALSEEDQRAALNRAAARHRLVQLLTEDAARAEHQEPSPTWARYRLGRLLRSRSTARATVGGAPCRS